MSALTAWHWIAPLALLLTALGAALRRLGAAVRWAQDTGQVLLTAGLTVFAAWAAAYLAVFGIWLYSPVLAAFRDNPVAVPAAVYTQALLMSGAVVAVCRRRWLRLLPVLVFAVVLCGFAAWLTVNPDRWLPAPS